MSPSEPSEYLSPSHPSRTSGYESPDADGIEDIQLLAPSSEDEGDIQITKTARTSARRLQAQHYRSAFCSRRFVIFFIVACVCLAAIVTIFFRNRIAIVRLRLKGIPPGLYSRDGSLYIGENTPFMIKGFSWYGCEEEHHSPGGLDKISVQDVLDFAKENHFNAIRMPLSVENVERHHVGIDKIAPFKNPKLSALSYLDMLLSVVQMAAADNILILLDIHRLQNNEVQSGGYWHSKNVKEEQLLGVWKKLCKIFGKQWNVLGGDLFNEPWKALWNSSDASNDWKRASEKLGNTIHKSCPSWLLLVEGVGNDAGGTNTGVFWAENLKPMENLPPRPKLKSKVALSPHVYGPAVYMQDYFKKPDFPKNMPKIWDDHFGGASAATGLATIVGEWGGTLADKDKVWQETFMQYILKNKMGFFYWCLNPESGDTGGLLKSDWRTPETGKLNILSNAPYTDVEQYADHFKYMRNWRTS